MTHPPRSSSTLLQAPHRLPLTLTGLEVPNAQQRRLAALGLRRGAQVSVLHATSGGGRVVSVAGSRIALDKSILEAINVEMCAS